MSYKMTKQREIAMKHYSFIENEEKRLNFIKEEEQKYGYLHGKTPEELKMLPAVAQYKAYNLGFLISKTYTDEELVEIKERYLNALPSPKSGLTVKRWQAEVERRFNMKSFHIYPDKIFLSLDRILQTGSPS